MQTALQHPRRGFTLVEIMIVVAIIGLLSAIAVPNFLRARKRTQATLILQDLRILDYAMDRWALEKNKAVGDAATFSDLLPYIRENTQLANSGADLFGASYGNVFSVDVNPRVPTTSFDALSDVAPTAFWSPYN